MDEALALLEEQLDHVCEGIAAAAVLRHPALGNPEPARLRLLARPHGTDECELVRIAKRAERIYAAVCAVREEVS